MKDEDLQKHARDFTTDRENPMRVADWREDGLRIIVLTLGGTHFTAYIGIPLDHPLAGFDYEKLPINAHGGLTFADKGDGKFRPEGYYWYGWDYAHSGDYSYYGEIPGLDNSIKEYEQDWTLGEVKSDAWHAIYDMKHLMDLAEAISNKAKNG